MNSNELRIAISSFGLTQRDFASQIGVTPRTVERWCAGCGAEKPDKKTDKRGVAVPEPVARIVRASMVDRTVLDRISGAR
jgi:hypothetical protein